MAITIAATRKAYHRAWWEKNGHRYGKRPTHRRAEIKYSHGITLEEYDAKLQAQNNLCGLCKEPFEGSTPNSLAPCLDHNHATGAHREFIHRKCNTAIGLLGDDPVKLRLAAEYLEKHRGN